MHQDDMTGPDSLEQALADLRAEADVQAATTEERYARLGLNFNPFPIAGIATGSRLMPPIRDEHVERVIAFIQSTYLQKEFGGLAIIGDYGMGKTHLMRYLVDMINRMLGSQQARPALAVYVENPGLTARDIIHRIVEEIGEG